MDYRELNGVKTFAPLSRNELIELAYKNHKILVAVNAEKVLHATDDFRDIIKRNIGYPDGLGAVMALKQKGLKNAVKIPGCELWLDVVKQFQHTKTFYIVGGKQEVVEATVQKLNIEFKGINIVNYRNGYIRTNKEKNALLQDIIIKKPDVVFVAMGSPKQELLMQEMIQQHAALYQGLGGSFDVYTGILNRAPKWWIKNNMEWAYRLFKEPSRIKRQIHLLRFLYLLKTNKL